MDPALAIHPLTPDRWPDLERLFGPKGAVAGCWCMWWRLKRRDWDAGKPDGNRSAFRARVERGPPPGLLAYSGETAVGWCQVTPRAELPTLNRSRALVPVDDAPVWSLSCFYIKAGWRRRGVMTALIAAAVELARQAGAPALEAYPWDTREAKSSTTVYTGLAASFRKAGFVEVARRQPHRPMLRYRFG